MAPKIAEAEPKLETAHSNEAFNIKPEGSPLILRTHTPEGRAAFNAMLDNIYNDDPEEQKETWAIIKNALDQDRLSHRKLFP